MSINKLYRHFIPFGSILFGMIVLFVFSGSTKNPKAQKGSSELNTHEIWADSLLKQMSLEEKIGQLFMIQTYSRNGAAHEREIEQLIKTYQPGGVIFFQGGPARQLKMTKTFQAAAKYPLLVSIDGEWGLSMRLDSCMQFPRQLTLGAIGDNRLIYEMGKEIGRQCRRLGIQINLAPVVDVNSNPNNPVINDRSFGEDKYNVSLKGLMYMEGLQDADVMACAKHFPGHGDTDKDSHKTLPVINQTRSELHDTELYPFKILFNGGIQSVMAAHIHVPSLDDTEGLATSLSKKVITDLLRDSLGYEGLVFSDALNMKGVSDYFEAGELDLKALQAGNDVLLFPNDLRKGVERIRRAVEEGDLAESEIDQRVFRILRSKSQLSLRTKPVYDTTDLMTDLHPKSAEVLKHQLYKNAITIAKSEDNLIPLRDIKAKKIAVLNIEADKDNQFARQLDLYSPVDAFSCKKNIPQQEANELIDKLSAYEVVIIGLHGISRYASKQHGIDLRTVKLLSKLSKRTEVVLTVFGTPYALQYFSFIKHAVVAYEDNEICETYAAQALFGGIAAKGTLPVSAGEHFKAGDGIVVDKAFRLTYSPAEETGLNGDTLELIDQIVQEALDMKATPGCQVLVARKGKVVFNKSYGYHTYEKDQPVLHSDLYDLASITKIAATTASLMRLYDEGLIDINDTLGTYLPEFKDTNHNISGLAIKEVLTHTARLRSWIPFYKATVNDSIYDLYYCDDEMGDFCVKVTDDLFMTSDYTDSIWSRIGSSDLREKPGYKYSDLGFYLFERIIQNVTGVKLDTLAEELFYKPLGLNRMCYRPLDRFQPNQITPTEDDQSFRKRLVHGYVHDPGAAMLGGVGGHAGLFSNAIDLATFAQMLLNGGEFGEEKYLKKETIDLFTTRHFEASRRGLGFDKPEPDKNKSNPTCDEAPLSTYGHTGFTGTCVWVDPENELVYVFLSNRVHPKANNWKLVKHDIRTRIQSVIYRSMIEEASIGHEQDKSDDFNG